MKLPQCSADKAYSAMRSLFRYIEFQAMGSPDILIENEKRILERRFKELTVEEFAFFVVEWSDYYKREVVESEIQNDRIMAAVEQEIRNLN